MKLTELEPQFIIEKTDGDRRTLCYVESVKDAEGIMFLCPTCFAKNKGRPGTHMVICWFRGRVPDERYPRPGRWIPEGTNFADLTFTNPGARSVELKGGCNAHFHITNGEIK